MQNFLPEDFDSLLSLLNYFATEQDCVRYLQHRRWGDSPTCPHCEHTTVYRFSDGKRFKCVGCKKQFTVTVGTFFENSKIPLRKLFVYLYLLTAHKKGISYHQLARDIAVTQRTAWFMLQRLRHSLGYDQSPEPFESTVEVDKTFVGGKNKNRHKAKKVANSQGRCFVDKTPVLGILQRGDNRRISRVQTVVIPDTSASSIQPVLLARIKPKSRSMSDEWKAYNGLNQVYEHNIVNHGAKQYVREDVYTNTLEGFWTWLKRSYIGIYHFISRKHLQLYAQEVAFRYNTRDLRNGRRLALALLLKSGPLKYKDLVHKFGNG